MIYMEGAVTSFVQTRGSVPLFWEQTGFQVRESASYAWCDEQVNTRNCLIRLYSTTGSKPTTWRSKRRGTTGRYTIMGESDQQLGRYLSNISNRPNFMFCCRTGHSGFPTNWRRYSKLHLQQMKMSTENNYLRES